MQQREIAGLPGEHVEQQAAHFVGGVFTPSHSLRRSIWITVIAGRVVVGQFAIESRVLGQGHQILKQILILPVEIPLPDPEQNADLAAGQGGGQLGFFGEVVRVCRNADSIHIRGQGERSAYLVICLPRRNIDVGAHAEEGRHLNLRHRARRRGTEIEADHSLLALRQAVGMEVRLHQEVGTLGQGYRDALGKKGGRRAGHPSAEPAI